MRRTEFIFYYFGSTTAMVLTANGFRLFNRRLPDSSAEQKEILSQPENHKKPMVHAQRI
jgi:hypothetical protein